MRAGEQKAMRAKKNKLQQTSEIPEESKEEVREKIDRK